MTPLGTVSPIGGTRVVTAVEMREVEAVAVADGTSPATLMRRAGEGVAEVVRRLAAGAEVMVLCGPGNNGGDGWVAAATLARHGHPVRVATPLGEPRTDLAREARAAWTGAVEAIGLGTTMARDRGGSRSPVVVDARLGIGLSADRPLALPLAVPGVIRNARLSVAVDLPSGLDSDTGKALGTVTKVDLTLALGHAKPAHLLQPGSAMCGTVRLLSLGIERSRGDEEAPLASVIGRPWWLPAPGPDANKFTRGMVAVVPGPMKGAALLASEAALRAGAGYVVLLDGGGGVPHALVRKQWSPAALADRRIGAVLVGNGLGRDDEARARVEAVLAAGHPAVLDGDALHLVTPERLAALSQPVIATPHHGEFIAAFGELPGSKIERARTAARRANVTVVYKGADTVIAHPDGGVVLAGEASHWLSTAGSGDVLAGTTAAMLASGIGAFRAAQAAVWLNGEAARR